MDRAKDLPIRNGEILTSLDDYLINSFFEGRLDFQCVGPSIGPRWAPMDPVVDLRTLRDARCWECN